jgi:hypothetical protein
MKACPSDNAVLPGHTLVWDCCFFAIYKKTPPPPAVIDPHKDDQKHGSLAKLKASRKPPVFSAERNDLHSKIMK